MIIDSHHHLWRLDHGYAWLADPAVAPIRRDYTVTDLRERITEAGVDWTVLVEAGRCDAAESTEFLDLAADTPEIAGVVAWLDFTAAATPSASTPSAQLFKSWCDERPRKLAGVRDQVQGHADPMWLARAEVIAGLRAIADAGLAIDLVVRPDQLAGAAIAAGAVPQGRFVLDHLGKPPLLAGDVALDAWRDDLARLAEHPNVVAKLSGLVTEADWARWTPAHVEPAIVAALELFGPERLLWGSDWPVCELASAYRRWLETARSFVPQRDHDAVFGGNAVRTYQLEID